MSIQILAFLVCLFDYYANNLNTFAHRLI